MQIKAAQYKIKGMRRDDSYSSFNPEYSWDNKNIRLTARDGNDLLSVTNEKGNLAIIHNEYYRRQLEVDYNYTPEFSGYVDTLTNPTYRYMPSFYNYKDVLLDEIYYARYTPLFYNYSNTLTNI